MPKQTLDVGQFLNERGLSVKYLNDDGDLIVETPEGERPLNRDSVLKDMGVPANELKKFDLQFNSPDSPVDQSPVSVIDRLKLTTSKENRSLTFLKNKFEDARLDPDKGVLVKDKGVWMKADASYLGDGTGWQKSKELMKDVVDVADEIASGFLEGGVSAAADTIAPYVGGIAAAAAAAKVGSKARFRLGKMLGTYDATPEQQIEDENLEALMAAGGQAVAPVFGGFIRALGKGVAATPLAIRKLQATMLKVDDEALRQIGQNPDGFIETTKSLWKEGVKQFGKDVTADKVQQLARNEQQKIVGEMVEKSRPALSRSYVRALVQTARQAGEDFEVNVGQLATDIFEKLSGKNPMLKKEVKTVVNEAGEELSKTVYRPIKDAEVLADNGEVFFDKKAFQRFVNQLAPLMEEGSVTGAKAVQRLAQIKQQINRLAQYPAQAAKNFPDEMRKLTRLNATVDSVLDGAFGKEGSPLRNVWKSKSADYERYSNAVKWGENVLNDPTGKALENFTQQAMAWRPGAKQSAKTALGALPSPDLNSGSIGDLLGKKGQAYIDRLNLLETSRQMAPKTPRLGVFQALGAFGAFGSKLGFGPVAAGLAVGAAQSTPAVVGAELAMKSKAQRAVAEALRPTTDLIKGAAKAGKLDVLYRNPKLQNQLIQVMTKAAGINESTSAQTQEIVNRVKQGAQ